MGADKAEDMIRCGIVSQKADLMFEIAQDNFDIQSFFHLHDLNR